MNDFVEVGVGGKKRHGDELAMIFVWTEFLREFSINKLLNTGRIIFLLLKFANAIV